MGNVIAVGISEAKITTGDDILVSYALGSCIGTCLYDSTAKIIGLSHILLPSSNLCPHDNNIYKFADTAIKELVERMRARGASTSRIQAKIAGGAQMFLNSTMRIGDDNKKAVINELNMLGIRIIAADVGENYGRTMECHAKDGKVFIKTINKSIKVL
ncbi:MAG: hypothetical protein A2Y15_00530 [Clostridiales bacterium GWF2_36_10]|nr:MAG: hypothetical protein A2Y15_00530 [Clostridiales bacterium GWF2_36_10]HAN21723.1 chemotaxis protein CheD [Clostridiales bacterium]